MKSHFIRAIDFIILAGTLLSIIFVMRYTQPLVIAPINDLTTTNNSVLFSFEKGDAVLIDDNPQFTSPDKISVADNFVITLEPGVYYWKVSGVEDSEIRKFTILSSVDLKMKQTSTKGVYDVVNAGNTRLNVDVFNGENASTRVVLDVDENKEIAGTKFVGAQHA